MSKKKIVTPSQPLRDDMEISIIGLNVNIARAAEICMVGDHYMTLYYMQDIKQPEHSVKKSDIDLIIEDLDLLGHLIAEGDLLVEVVRPDFDSVRLAMRRQYETMDDIQARVKQAKEFDEPELNTMSDACLSLLKTSYERLNLSVSEVKIIQKVSQTIARMSFSKEIRPEHIAEAIQYRAPGENMNMRYPEK